MHRRASRPRRAKAHGRWLRWWLRGGALWTILDAHRLPPDLRMDDDEEQLYVAYSSAETRMTHPNLPLALANDQ